MLTPRILLAPLFLLMVFPSCGVKQPPFTKKEPKTADLVGSWTPDASTINIMQQKGGYNSSIPTRLNLREDGTFELSNMPDWWNNGEGRSAQNYDQYSGKWTIIKDEPDRWMLTLYSTKGIRPVDLLGEGPYRLFFVIGDPDNNLTMTFNKE
jgi:hypothetical protein